MAEWSASFWDCCSPAGLCCTTFWCPCITFGKTRHRLQKGSLAGYSCCNGACCIWTVAAMFGLPCIPNMMQRSDIRERGNLEGGCCGDFCRSWCCLCCDLMQQDKEAERLTTQPMVMQQPGRPGGMHYPA